MTRYYEEKHRAEADERARENAAQAARRMLDEAGGR
jgi:hypothetical protein